MTRIKPLCSGLHHVGLPTTCMEKSICFYEKLGFRIVQSINTPQHDVRFLQAGQLLLELYQSEDAKGRTGAWDHIALQTEDIEEAFQKVQQMQMPLLSEKIEFLPFWEYGIRYFILEGPNKERIEFHQKVMDPDNKPGFE